MKKLIQQNLKNKRTNVIGYTLAFAVIAASIFTTSIVSVEAKAANIGTTKAKQIALQKTNGGKVTKCKLDSDDGVSVYEVEVRNGSYEYDLEIHATSGKILEFDQDYDD